MQLDRRVFSLARLVQSVGKFAEVDAGHDAGRPGFIAQDRLRRRSIERFQPKFQRRWLGRVGRQDDPVAVGQPLPGNLPAVYGNSPAAVQVLKDPTFGVGDDFRMLAGEMR